MSDDERFTIEHCVKYIDYLTEQYSQRLQVIEEKLLRLTRAIQTEESKGPNEQPATGSETTAKPE